MVARPIICVLLGISTKNKNLNILNMTLGTPINSSNNNNNNLNFFNNKKEFNANNFHNDLFI